MEKTVNEAKAWLEELLGLMGMPCSVAVTESQANSLVMGPWLVIDEKGLTAAQIDGLLGDHGEGLDAIQYLLNSMLRHRLGDGEAVFTPLTVELDQFRAKRQLELISLSETVAQQVRETHQPVEMAHMSAADRRQVHSFFKDAQDLETESQGQEPHRRLVVRPRR